jgi:hypothetical protein
MSEHRDYIKRRALLKGAVGAAVIGLTSPVSSKSFDHMNSPEKFPFVREGRINQSITYWCFEEYWNVVNICFFH